MPQYDRSTERLRKETNDPDRTVSLPPMPMLTDDQRKLLPKRFHPVLLCLSQNQHGQCFKLENEYSILGRSRDVDFLIDDIRASRRHLKITYENYQNPEVEPVCWIEDLNSRNGTELNGKPLEERIRLNDHDRIVVGKTVIGFYFRDELEIMQQEQLYVSATRDPLTGLLNRHQIDSRLAEEIHLVNRFGNDLVLMLVDIDHFKNVNDTYGHSTGDEVLQHVAKLLSDNSDDRHYVARWGGEEFAVVAAHAPPELVQHQAEKLRSAIEGSPHKTDAHEIRITVSIGMSAAHKSDTPESLFRRADKCLYEAKEGGRNQVVFRDPGATS